MSLHWDFQAPEDVHTAIIYLVREPPRKIIVAIYLRCDCICYIYDVIENITFSYSFIV